ncbi:MAG: NAD(P)/FAD-dependent oxidoreductase [Candidatus Sericytochromatia bacterium]|nr:NAD(P)/FAD-dependent oxidoreductase [Candidatus Sericytochromatia bacterium]
MQQSQATGTKPRIVIVGAGFGGLNAARTLSGQPVDVLVLNRNNYHGFWPLLYQVATAGLEPESIAYPVRAILQQYRNVAFQMANVSGIDFDGRRVLTDGEPVPYDFLILAAGSTSNYFGNRELETNTFGMKDIDEAEALRNHVLLCFEQAVREPDPDRRAALMTFVIVGGGPTGVELAGAFSELVRHVLPNDYPMLDLALARVLLVEAGEHILATFPQPLQDKALAKLKQMGVDIRLGTAVEHVDQSEVVFKDGRIVPSCTVVWAAGVKAAELADRLGVTQARAGRIPVAPTLALPGHPEVFIIGDMAYLEGYNGHNAFPMVAQVAIQQGKLASANILAELSGRPQQPFKFFDKGSMATIGRRAAIMDAFGIQLSGFLAWLGWLFIHLIELIGFRNRLIVLMNWMYNYFTYDRGVRLITNHLPPVRPLQVTEAAETDESVSR